MELELFNIWFSGIPVGTYVGFLWQDSRLVSVAPPRDIFLSSTEWVSAGEAFL